MKKIACLSSFALIMLMSACGDQKSEKRISVPETETAASEKTTKSDQNSTLQSQTDSSAVADQQPEQPKSDPDSIAVKADSASVETEIVPKEYFALIPDKLKRQGIINEDDIPTVKEIGIKPPPDSYALKIGKPFKYKGKTYNTLEMVSADSPEKMLAFYNKWKEEWYYVEESGVHTFKKDKDIYFRETNNLQIQPFNLQRHPEADTLISFEPKTYIFIYYEVKPSEEI